MAETNAYTRCAHTGSMPGDSAMEDTAADLVNEARNCLNSMGRLLRRLTQDGLTYDAGSNSYVSYSELFDGRTEEYRELAEAACGRLERAADAAACSIKDAKKVH